MFVKGASLGYAARGAYHVRLSPGGGSSQGAKRDVTQTALRMLASPLDHLRGAAEAAPALRPCTREGGGAWGAGTALHKAGDLASQGRTELLSGRALEEAHEGDSKREPSAQPLVEPKKVGAFQQLPAVSPAYEILGSALKRARMVKPTKGIANATKRERNRGAKQLDALTKELAGPLGMYIRRFPSRDQLHPFERCLLELTLGDGVYEQTLDRVNAARKRILDVGKNAAAQVNKCTTKREAEDALAAGYARLEELYQRHSAAVDALKEVAKTLRAMPVVRPRLPTLCLVGAPNVGKSSLVRVLSSGKPEVCNYPFTTRGISMGHFFVDDRRHQVTDTPGLLHRPEEKRNNIERLTLAALEHLPCAVLFVHDLTEDCGTSVEDQFHLHATLKARFGSRPWLDVLSKADLLPPRPSGGGLSADADCLEAYRNYGAPGALRVSNQTEEGIEELVARVHGLLSGHALGEADGSDADEDVHALPADPKEELRRRQEEFYFPALPPDMLRGV